MCEPAIHVLKSVFTRLVRQNAFASVAPLRVAVFLCIHHRLQLNGKTNMSPWIGSKVCVKKLGNLFNEKEQPPKKEKKKRFSDQK